MANCLWPAPGSSCLPETDSTAVRFMQKCGQMRMISCSFPKGQTKAKAKCSEMIWNGMEWGGGGGMGGVGCKVQEDLRFKYPTPSGLSESRVSG